MPWGFSTTVGGPSKNDVFWTSFDAGIHDPAGVQEFIYVGCDVLAVLQRAHRQLGL